MSLQKIKTSLIIKGLRMIKKVSWDEGKKRSAEKTEKSYRIKEIFLFWKTSY